MLCSPHHEIFKNISYHFKFNLKFQFRIPEFKTTSIVHLATWPYQNYQLTTLIAKCIAQYTCYYKKEIPITKVHSIIMFIYQSKMFISNGRTSWYIWVQNICHQVQNILPAGLLSSIQNIREHQHKWW